MSRIYLRDGNDKIAHRDVLAREWEIVQAAHNGIGRKKALNHDSSITGNHCNVALDSRHEIRR